MPRKPKFRPEITRIRLNPEQAVLTCECYRGDLYYLNTQQWDGVTYTSTWLCRHNEKLSGRNKCVAAGSVTGIRNEAANIGAS